MSKDGIIKFVGEPDKGEVEALYSALKSKSDLEFKEWWADRWKHRISSQFESTHKINLRERYQRGSMEDLMVGEARELLQNKYNLMLAACGEVLDDRDMWILVKLMMNISLDNLFDQVSLADVQRTKTAVSVYDEEGQLNRKETDLALLQYLFKDSGLVSPTIVEAVEDYYDEPEEYTVVLVAITALVGFGAFIYTLSQWVSIVKLIFGI